MTNDPIKLVDVGALDRFKTDIENEIPDSVQYSTMPTASAELNGAIVQYTGSTTASYTNGYFYKCVAGSTSGTYEWTPVSVQSGGGGTQVQSDWGQTDTTAVDFIKNKPDLTEHLPIIPKTKTETDVVVSFDDVGTVVDVAWTGLTNFSGYYVWTDGTDIYYSYASTQYVLDKSTSTWTAKTWTGLTSFYGNDIWTDGTDIYHSVESTQYVLDKSTSTWTAKTWTGLTSFYGSFVWTDGTNIYYSYNANQYVLDKSTSTWTTKTWTGLTRVIGNGIWTDGTDIYYSNESTQYVLDKSTSTWFAKTWDGLSSFSAAYIWTDGTDVYYSNGNIHKKIINRRHINNNFNGNSGNVQSDWNQTDDTADDYIKNKPTALPASNTTSAYSSTGTDPVNGTAVAAAIGGLDVSSVGGSGKYIQSISETDGKISATAVDVPGFLEQINITGGIPEASSEYINRIVQFSCPNDIGIDGFYNGDIVTCESSTGSSGTTYSWEKIIPKGATANTVTDTTVTISAANWSGSSAPYTATKSVTGMLSTDTPIIDVVVSSTTSTGLDQLEQYSYISRAATSNGTITFYCYEDKPTISLTISIKIIR